MIQAECSGCPSLVAHLCNNYCEGVVVLGEAVSPTNVHCTPFGHAWTALLRRDAEKTSTPLKGCLLVEPTAPVVRKRAPCGGIVPNKAFNERVAKVKADYPAAAQVLLTGVREMEEDVFYRYVYTVIAEGWAARPNCRWADAHTTPITKNMQEADAWTSMMGALMPRHSGFEGNGKYFVPIRQDVLQTPLEDWGLIPAAECDATIHLGYNGGQTFTRQSYHREEGSKPHRARGG